MSKEKMLGILKTLKGKSFAEGSKILENKGLTNNNTHQEDGLSDSYFMINPANWFCYTCGYTEVENDENILHEDGNWNACIEDEMYYANHL